MRLSLRSLLVAGILFLGLFVMFLAVFIETAASATNDYRLTMVLGLALAAVADACFYWSFSNGRVFARTVALVAGVPSSLFIIYDWVARAPGVFRIGLS